MKKIVTIVVMVMLSILTTQAQWTSEASGFSAEPQRGIIEMEAVNATTAWALSYPRGAFGSGPWNEVTHTSDGVNWIPSYISGTPNDAIWALGPVSATTAFAMSYDMVNYTGGRILKTSDGGTSWSTVSDTTTMFYGGFPDNIKFFDANNGIAQGDPNGGVYEIYLTHDGGTTWTKVPSANIPAPLTDVNGNIIEFGETFMMSIVGNTVWTTAVNSSNFSFSRIFKSYEIGLHWYAYTSAVTGAPGAIKMRDQNHGLMKTSTATSCSLYRTSDGGITWSLVNTSGNFFAFDLAYVHGTTSTWVSTGGELNGINGIGSSYSTDDGVTWTTIDTGVDHQAIDMVNQYAGFTGGFNTSPTTDGIFSYTGGAIGCGCIAPTNTAIANVAGTTAYAS